MPAGYQITQHFSPIAREGKLDYVVVPRHEDGEEQQRTPVQKSIRIIQVQIEQVVSDPEIETEKPSSAVHRAETRSG